MRSSAVLIAAWCVCASAQQTTTYKTDLNGRRITDGVYSATQDGKTSTRTEMTQSINGRMVPLESTEEKVVKEDSTGRVVERLIRRYDANGNPTSAEKQQVQEKFNSDGSVSSVLNVYRGDINGGYAFAERVVTDSSKSGDAVQANVIVERATINGSTDVVEKQTKVTSGEKDTVKSDVTTFRKDNSGRFVQHIRVVSDSKPQDGARVENTVQYELADNGQLRVASQTVARVRKNPDGTESKEVDIFRAVPGRADPSAAPRLQERQVIEQRKSGEQLVETTLVQRPTINDPGHLGPAQRISEKVCTGKGCN